MYDFDEVIDRRGTQSVKYEGIKMNAPNASDDCIPLWIADMDFKCAPPIIDAIRKRLDNGIFGYTAIYDPAYFNALSKWYKQRYDVNLPMGAMSLSNGVVSAINALVSLMTKEGDNVIIATPSYEPFYRAVKRAGGRNALFNPLKYQDGSYSIDLCDFEKKAADKNTTLFILCNPHNPTGRAWNEAELKSLYDICKRNNVKIISDEIHADLTRLSKSTLSMAKLFPGDKDVVICTAPSKTFNLAGNQLSHIFINDEVLKEAFDSYSHASPSPYALAATQAAYEKCGGWLDELRGYLDNNFDLLDSFLKEELPDALYRVPDATYLAWVNLSSYGFNDDELEKRAAAGGVLIEAGQHFVANAEGFVRINCACPASVLKEGLRRLSRSLKA